MDNFKAASQQKLRFTTNKGVLTTEQLWELSLEELDSLAISLEGRLEQSGRKSFITKSTEKSKIIKLQFDIVIDILTTKMEELEAARTAKEVKDHNTKILNLIAEKKEEDLKGKSIEDLEKLLKQ